MSQKLDAIKKKILDNRYVDQLRIQMRIDDGAYDQLCASLQELASELKGVRAIDKELALALYSIPLMVRNTFLSFDNQAPKPEIAARLEDHWVDLDALVTDCLSEQS